VLLIFSLEPRFLSCAFLLKGRTQCWIELGESWKWQLYMSLVASVLFIIPALIISLCYAIIVKTIWEKGTYMGTKARGRKGKNGRGDDEEDRGSRRASSRGIIPRAKVKTVQMTFVIVIVFIACWSPYIVIQSLAPLNSAANPLIYCLFSTQIGKTFRLVQVRFEFKLHQIKLSFLICLPRRTHFFRWLSRISCCKKKENPQNLFANGRFRGGARNLHQNYDSTRTFTTSLTVTSRRSTCLRPNRVVIIENQKTILATQEEVNDVIMRRRSML
jgi:neuropeptide S receptor